MNQSGSPLMVAPSISTQSRLRRWHFDVALLLGIGLLSLCYWLLIPRPRWERTIPTDAKAIDVSLIGFSEDSAYFYTLKDVTYFWDGRLPTPTIQEWDTVTGDLIREYPLQMPEKDRKVMESLATQAPNARLFTLAVFPGEYETVFVAGGIVDHVIRSIYDLKTGNCLGRNPVGSIHPLVVGRNPRNQNFLIGAAIGILRDVSFEIIDLGTGERVHWLHSPPEHGLFQYRLTPSRKHLILWWYAGSPVNLGASTLDVYETKNWSLQQQIKLPSTKNGSFKFLDADEFEVSLKSVDGLKLGLTEQLIYRYSVAQSRFELVNRLELAVADTTSSQVWYGGRFLIQRDITQARQPESEPWISINKLLSKINLSIGVRPATLDHYVREAGSGRLLRQLTGVTEFGPSFVPVDKQGAMLAGFTFSGQQKMLALYDIPHQLYERSLGWAMYLSWLLILPWPFRYLCPNASKQLSVPRE